MYKRQDWIDELSELHDRVEEVPYVELERQLEEDLGAPPHEVFASFETEPLAAGSIAQVHRARLTDGTEVVLKIRRPGIRGVVEADLRLLARLAEAAESELPDLARFRPRALVRQLSRSLRDELDLRVEARNTEAIAENCAGESRLVVPEVHWEWSGERICVQDYLEGTSAAAWARTGEPAGLDCKGLAALGARVVLEMVLIHGLFHADPHPGNVVFLPDGRLGLLDFGMVGRLSDHRRRELAEILAAVVSQDERRLVDLLLEWSGEGEVDVETFSQDCRAFIQRYYGLSLAELDVGRLLADVTALVRENDLVLPGDVALLIKVFLTLESFGRLLDPDFEMTAQLEPFIERLLRSHFSPVAVFRRGMSDLTELVSSLPSDLRQLATKARRGRLKLELELRRLDHFGRQLDRSANRVTVGLVTAALIVGTSIALTVPSQTTVLGLPLFGFLGFVSSSALGFWLLWSVLRSPRP